MKWPHVVFASLALIHSAIAGESALTTTYQPLDGLGAGEIFVTAVACHHWNAGSVGSAVDLIGLKNVPPTDNPKEAKDDLNLASVCGVKFSTSDLGDDEATPNITMDMSNFSAPANGYPREEVVRASLECLRRCRPEKLLKTPVTLKCKDDDKEWLSKIVDEFNKHDQAKVFYPAEQ